MYLDREPVPFSSKLASVKFPIYLLSVDKIYDKLDLGKASITRALIYLECTACGCDIHS